MPKKFSIGIRSILKIGIVLGIRNTSQNNLTLSKSLTFIGWKSHTNPTCICIGRLKQKMC
jgi:hypothetical protein